MDRTTATTGIPPDNYAQSYFAVLHGEQTLVDRPHIASGTVMSGANGIKSCVNDLLKYYYALICRWRNETGIGEANTFPNPSKNVLQSE